MEAADQPDEVLAKLLLKAPDCAVLPPSILVGRVRHDAKESLFPLDLLQLLLELGGHVPALPLSILGLILLILKVPQQLSGLTSSDN